MAPRSQKKEIETLVLSEKKILCSIRCAYNLCDFFILPFLIFFALFSDVTLCVTWAVRVTAGATLNLYKPLLRNPRLRTLGNPRGHSTKTQRCTYWSCEVAEQSCPLLLCHIGIKRYCKCINYINYNNYYNYNNYSEILLVGHTEKKYCKKALLHEWIKIKILYSCTALEININYKLPLRTK